MKTIDLDPRVVIINPEVSARAGDPDEEKVDRLAMDFISRRNDGQAHQLQPGIVRVLNGKGKTETYELVAGRHRLNACIRADETQESDEPFLFSAVVVRADDKQAMIDALTENEFRVESSMFDRAAAIERLVACGLTQSEVAAKLQESEGTVSQYRAVAKLGGKYRKALENGDIERDAAVLLANVEDETQQAEIFDVAIRNKQRFEELEARVQVKRDKKEADAAIEAAKLKATETKEAASAAEKARKEAEKLAAKAKDVKDVEKAREAVAATTKAEKAAKKEADKATKAIEKAKEAKSALTAPTKKKVSQEDIKKAAKSVGAKVGRDSGPTKLKMTEFYIGLESLPEIYKETNKGADLPKNVADLIGKIEEYADGEIDEKRLLKAFLVFGGHVPAKGGK